MIPSTKLNVANKQTAPKPDVEIQLFKHITATQKSREKEKARE